jgi:FixJ family two-component response regulator
MSMFGEGDIKSGCQPHVLIADDDQGMRVMLSDWLMSHGYKPIVAQDGGETLALAVSQLPDLALVDVRMPGPSGVTLAERLKDLHPEIEVIITAYGSVEEAAEAVRRGVFHYLAKPLNLERVLAVVKEAWDTRQARVQVLSDLTCREREVLALVAGGKTNAEIAEALSIEQGTVLYP